MSKPTYEEILNIQRKVNIVDIIKEYMPLKQSGKNYFGICPFHDDHNPSMSVSSEKQIYKCFVCGSARNVFNFVSNYEKISYYDAVKKVASKIGINIDIGNINNDNNIKYINEYKIYDFANKYYQNNLNTSLGNNARNYLKKRQISDNIVEKFQIGLSFNDNKLTDLLLKKGFDEEELIKSGISIRNSNNKILDIYRNRLMFPLWDINGKTIGFSGRVYEGNDQSKYINTMETDIFKKGKLLYNYNNAREEVLKKDEIIIVEGFMDVIRLYTIGIYNVCATMGTAITTDQVNLIRKLTNNIILMFDGDSAGKKATNSFIEVKKDIDFNIKIVRLEEDLDPDDYILKKGKDKMLEHLQHPYSIYDYEINNFKENIDMNNPNDISKFIKDISSMLSKIDDDIVFELEVNKICKMTNLSKELILSKINRNKNKKITKPKEIKVDNKISNKYDKASTMILYLMINNPSYIDYYYENLCYLPNKTDNLLASKMVSFYRKYKSFNLSDFIIYLENNNELINRIIYIDNLKLKKDVDKNIFDEYINSINEYRKNKKINELKNKLRNETNEVIRKELADEILKVIKGV